MRHCARLAAGQNGQTDLNILRLAVYELLYRSDIPVEVTNEAVEMAKNSGWDSGKTNGVLGTVIRAIREMVAVPQRLTREQMSRLSGLDTSYTTSLALTDAAGRIRRISAGSAWKRGQKGFDNRKPFSNI